MQLISINIGSEQTLARPNKTEQTGIFKQPVSGPVEISTLGLPGDFIGDAKNHGGPDQAVYLYGWDDYQWWAAQLGREMTPGMFGENLTIMGLESARCNVGDRLVIGAVILEVTSPRIPCGTLAGRMEIPDFARQFRFAERPGLYCRVLEPGTIEAGQSIIFEPYIGETINLVHMARDHYEPKLDESEIQRFLAAPIAIRWRKKKEGQLREAQRLGE